MRGSPALWRLLETNQDGKPRQIGSKPGNRVYNAVCLGLEMEIPANTRPRHSHSWVATFGAARGFLEDRRSTPMKQVVLAMLVALGLMLGGCG